MTLEEEYYIFRHFISRKKYKVPINFDKPQNKQLNSKDFRAIDSILRHSLFDVNLKNQNTTAFCSGGLDSSLLTAIADIKHIYTATFPDCKEDESMWAHKVARHLNIKHTVVPIKEKTYKDTFKTLIKNKGEPLHPNEPCLYLVAKQMVKDGYTQVLSGEGADDIFGGYDDLLKNQKKYFKSQATFLLRYAYVYRTAGCPEINIPFEKWKKWGMERFLLEIHTPGLIQRAQNVCECAGIKPIFPYLESGLPQLMWEAKSNFKSNKNTLKHIASEYLPPDIVHREKIGFPIPMKKWFGGYEKFMNYNLKIWKNLKKE